MSSGEDLLLVLLSEKMNKREEKQGFTSLKKIQHEPLPYSVNRHFTVGKHSGLVHFQRRPKMFWTQKMGVLDKAIKNISNLFHSISHI